MRERERIILLLLEMKKESIIIDPIGLKGIIKKILQTTLYTSVWPFRWNGLSPWNNQINSFKKKLKTGIDIYLGENKFIVTNPPEKKL